MATMKKAAPKAQKGKKVSPMAAYVDKYKNSGGLSGNVANDTLGGNSPRFNNYDGGFAGGRMNQIKDLKAAHDKKFGPNSTVDERKNGGKVAKKKMKNGGSLSGLKASTKRDKGIDPKGAYTTVQKRTLAGAKGKAKLTPDKQLGATKMTAKRGMKISKKK